jgi:GC-rich sequence DNA-binding factor
MWKKRSERLIERRRKDVEDEYLKCRALSDGKPWNPNQDAIFREGEREARRKRRRIQLSSHFEGMSSDDEETTSQQVEYKETLSELANFLSFISDNSIGQPNLDSVLEQAKTVLIDTADEFCKVEHIVNHFADWCTADEKSFEDAYISLCIPKLISPFIRLDLLGWDPLRVRQS